MPGAPHVLPIAPNEFKKAFYALVVAIGIETGYVHDAGVPYDGVAGDGWGSKYYAVPPGTVEALRFLWIAVIMACDHEYSRGHRDGRNLLSGLANGTITTVDFDRQSSNADTRGEKR